VVVRPKGDGFELLDGHLRAGMDPEAELPAVIVDLDDDESAKLLATFDPLGDLARPDPEALGKLIQGLQLSDFADLRKLHSDIADAMQRVVADIEKLPAEEKDKPIPAMELQPHESYDYLIVLATRTQDWNALCDRLELQPPGRKGKLGSARGIRADVLLKHLGHKPTSST
jgi:Asp-tRNA(Asn)/Glu-tRNA(Gln) amidotransferase A subunit family amidase